MVMLFETASCVTPKALRMSREIPRAGRTAKAGMVR